MAIKATGRRRIPISLAGALALAMFPGTLGTAQTPARPDDDVTRQQLAEMDHFLDSHPEIAEQLRKDPSLVRNQQFVESHPALQEYLQKHPGVREEYSENPNGFMRQEERYDRQEDRNNNNNDERRGDRDVTRQQLAEMDHFLDSHPEIAEQLRKDPSLVRNRQFVENHPALQEYLQKHPGVREEYSENPNGFMRQEERYDRHEDRYNDGHSGDVTRQQLAEMDHFLDSHPEVAEQLRKDPSLVNNREFVENHPALQEYLQKHPGVREEYSENPNGFMRQEERYDRREDDTARNNRMGTVDRDDRNRIADSERPGELASFGQFLGGHAGVAEQLSKDPALANNKEYRASHPELDEYLKAHPGLTKQLADNPQGVMTSNPVQQSTGTGVKTTTPVTKQNPHP